MILVAAAAVYVAAAAAFVVSLIVRSDPAVLDRLGGDAGDRRRSILARLGGRLSFPLSRVTRARVAELEMNDESVAVLRARKLLLGSFGIVVGGAAGAPWAAPIAAILGLAGFRAPDVALAREVAVRRTEIAASVPRLLDVLAVSVSAGLSPRLALERAPDAVGGRLRRELRRAHHDVALGTPWRAALRTVADRTGSSDLRRLAVTLERSERLGSPIGERLQALARDVRAERRARREERAGRAPVQMLFPLVFMILPAFVVAAVVPAVLVATRGLS